MNLDIFNGLANQTRTSGNTVYHAVLFSQSRIETGNFTSSLYRDYHNMFGMRPAVKRDRYYNGVENGFATYPDNTYSVIDRVDLDFTNDAPIPESWDEVEGYVDFVLSKGYSSDRKTYKKTWMQIIASYANGSALDGRDFNSDDSVDFGDLLDEEGNPLVISGKSPFWKKILFFAIAGFAAFKLVGYVRRKL